LTQNDIDGFWFHDLNGGYSTFAENFVENQIGAVVRIVVRIASVVG
jgi:hypothetical protein